MTASEDPLDNVDDLVTVIECAPSDAKRIKIWLEKCDAFEATRAVVRSDDDHARLWMPVRDRLIVPAEELSALVQSGRMSVRQVDASLVPLSARHTRTTSRSPRERCIEELRLCPIVREAFACPSDLEAWISHVLPSTISWERYDGFVLMAESFLSGVDVYVEKQQIAQVAQRTRYALFAALDRALRTRMDHQPLAFARKTSIPKGDLLRRPLLQWLVRPHTDLAPFWTSTCQNGVRYFWQPECTMFSAGNISEKERVARKWKCHGETVLDLYAGIGYWVLPLLVHSGASRVVACEWNDASVDGLERGLERAGHRWKRIASSSELDGSAYSCFGNDNDCSTIILCGDNRTYAPHLRDGADRVLLGLLPHARDGLPVAVGALRATTGGWLHVHENVADDAKERWTMDLVAVVRALLCDRKDVTDFDGWTITCRHVERVKSFAPHVYHLVADIECRPR